MINETIEERNAKHHEALALVEKFKADGGTVNIAPIYKREPRKESINYPSPEKNEKLIGMSSPEKVRFAMMTFPMITAQQITNFTGVHRKAIFAEARALQNEGLIERKSKLGHETVFTWIGE